MYIYIYIHIYIYIYIHTHVYRGHRGWWGEAHGGGEGDLGPDHAHHRQAHQGVAAALSDQTI